MQERIALTQAQINRDLLRPVLTTPLWFWFLAALLGVMVGGGISAFILLVIYGLGLAGINRPVAWGFFLVNFVFWIGISHAGVMISSILRLAQAEWRRPVTRAAEVLTVFSLATAALFPIVHAGRPWRVIYWIFPYDFFRGMWINVRSPIIWDPSAIFTYLTGASLFVFVALLPDLAVLRDRTRGWRHRAYGVLSLGWRGTPRQWKLQGIIGILLSALILPVFVSVHSIVSWDFAMTLVPTWHVSIFAPYFVIGAVHSGVSAVVTLMAIMRTIFRWHDYIRPDHFDALGRLLIPISTTWLFFALLDFFFALYSRETQEVAVWEFRFFTWPYSLVVIIFLLTAYVIPVPLWMFRRVRRNIGLMFWISILVNIGMWLERFLIIIPGLQYRQPLTFVWGEYTPSLVEFTIVAASFALVGLGLLLFSKFFPLVPLSDQKEEQVFKAEVQVGRARVPAIIRE